MPILEDIAVPAGDQRVPSTLDRLGQEGVSPQRSDPLATERALAPNHPAWSELFAAEINNSLLQPITNAFVQPSYPATEGFNPFAYIRENKDIDADPVAHELAARGQFDKTYSPAQFGLEYANGKLALEAAHTIQQASRTQAAAFFAGKAALQIAPLLIPGVGEAIGAAEAGVLGASARPLSKIALNAVVGGTYGLVDKKIRDYAMPATSGDPNSYLDELETIGAGAMLGGGLSTLGNVVNPRRLSQLKSDVYRVLLRKTPRDLPIEASGAARRLRPEDFPKTEEEAAAFIGSQLDVSLKDSGNQLREILEEPVTGDRSSHVLLRPGHENEKLLGQVIAKYKDAGFTFTPATHTEQSWLNIHDAVDTLRSGFGPSVEATPTDLGSGSAITQNVTKAVGSVSPVGRMLNETDQLASEIFRTVSGSGATVTKGSAADPTGYIAPVAAEGIHGSYGGVRDSVFHEVEGHYAKFRKETTGKVQAGTVAEDIQSRGDFNDAVGRYMMLESLQASGFDPSREAVAFLQQVPTAVKDASKSVRRYFGFAANELHKTGMLYDPNLDIADAKTTIAEIDRKIAQRTKWAQTAETEGRLDTASKHKDAITSLSERKAQATAAHEEASKAKTIQDLYFPRVHNRDLILADQEGFKNTAKQMWREQDSTVADKRVDEDQTPLIFDVAQNLDGMARQNLLGRVAGDEGATMLDAIDGLREIDLSPADRQSYRVAKEAYYTRQADAYFNNVTELRYSHGVADTIARDLQASNPGLARRLGSIGDQMNPYLETDPYRIVQKYHVGVMGKAAMKRAIQLNPALKGMTYINAAGQEAAIEDGSGLIQAFLQRANKLREYAGRVDEITLGRTSMTAEVNDMVKRFTRDMANGIETIEGTRPLLESAGGALGWTGRTLARLVTPIHMGSTALSYMQDFLGPLAMTMTDGNVGEVFGNALRAFKGASKADMELTGSLLEGSSRYAQMFDADAIEANGFGTGVTRKVSGVIGNATQATGEFAHKAYFLRYLGSLQKRWANGAVINRITQAAPRIIRLAEELAAAKANGPISDAAENAIFRKVGISRFDAARVNKWGVNAKTAATYLDQVYEKGLTAGDVPLKDVISKADFMAGKYKGYAKPNFAEWETPFLNERDRLVGLINSAVNRETIATPGIMDRPLWTRTPAGRVLAAMSNFAMAFTNQRIRAMGQMPVSYQLPHFMLYTGFGMMQAAIAQHLAGRRSFDQTAELLQKNPLGLVYEGIDRGGLTGWMSKYLALSDALGFSMSPGVLTGMTPSTMASKGMSSTDIGGALWQGLGGPIAQDLTRMVSVARDLGGTDPQNPSKAKPDKNTLYNALKLTPFNNWLVFRALNKGFGLPIIPEELMREETQRQNQKMMQAYEADANR